MKKNLIMLALTLMIFAPQLKEINAYKDYGPDMLILETTMETTIESSSVSENSLRHIC